MCEWLVDNLNDIKGSNNAPNPPITIEKVRDQLNAMKSDEDRIRKILKENLSARHLRRVFARDGRHYTQHHVALLTKIVKETLPDLVLSIDVVKKWNLPAYGADRRPIQESIHILECELDASKILQATKQ